MPAVLALLAGALVASPVRAAQTYTDTGLWLGYPYSLAFLKNTTVSGFADAKLVGQITNFQSTSPKLSCLNGLTINVYTAPAEFPGLHVVDDSLQGTVCARGAWTFGTYSYSGSWLNYPAYLLTLVPNACIECFGDSVLVGSVSSFNTQDPNFSCLNGQVLSTYTAAVEFPGRYIVHVKAGTMCTPFADTWTFPIFNYSGSWNGRTYGLTLVPNLEVESAPGANLITYQNTSTCGGLCGSPVRLQNFQTNDPNVTCMNGAAINVWMAQNEFPGKHVVHVAPGTTCIGFGGTWTLQPVSHYTITLKSFIPQSQLWDPDTSFVCSLLIYGSLTALTGNLCPYLSYSAENSVFGSNFSDPGAMNCWNPFDPLDTSVSGVFSGDGHGGFGGTARTETHVDFDWDPASRTISNFATTYQVHATSSVTLTYFWFGIPEATCTIYNGQGLQYPYNSTTSTSSFTLGSTGWDPFIPGETNASLCYLPSCGPYGDVIDATLNGYFQGDGTLYMPWTTDWFPSYGVQVWANKAYDAPQYEQTILDESGVNTMSFNGMLYIGFALKYYNAMTYACSPNILGGSCDTGSVTLQPAA